MVAQQAIVYRWGLVGALSLLTLCAPTFASDIDITLPELPEPVTELAIELTFMPPALPPAAVTIRLDEILPNAIEVSLGRGLSGENSEQFQSRLARKDREALAAFYAARRYQSLWVTNGAWNAAAQAVIQRLKAADEDALDPADYFVPTSTLDETSPVRTWADAELTLSASAILYAQHARGGRIDPSQLSKLMTPQINLPTAGTVLSALTNAQDPGRALADFNPPHPGYRALKVKLAELREQHPHRPVAKSLPNGPALRIGMRDPRVPLIRARLSLNAMGNDDTSYDERVASAVAAFQKEKGLPASGILTSQTVAALSGGPSPAHREDDLIANMERWRWLPVDLGARHIIVNVPEFRLRLAEDGLVVHQTRVITGRPETPTPIFSDEMEHVIVNPTWTVPPSILRKEFLPAMAQDPSYAERKGFHVIRKNGQISIQQPPGERNALGFVKFIFPNHHAVYLHDTPNRNLFTAERRALSHGCVRVDQPFRLAEEILGRENGWTEQNIRRLIGKGERPIRLNRPLPVHLAYFTLAVDEQGELKIFEDLYGFNRKVQIALGLER